MKENKVQDLQQRIRRDGSALKACTDRQNPFVCEAGGYSAPDKIHQLRCAMRGHERVSVTPWISHDVHFVAQFQENVAVTAFSQPPDRTRYRRAHRVVRSASVKLTKVEQPDDHRHAQSVCFGQHPTQALHVMRVETAVRPKGGVVPRLVLGVSERTAALQVDRDAVEAGGAPVGHGPNARFRIAVRVPDTSRPVPKIPGGRIEVVKGGLNHTTIQKQTLCSVPFPDSTGTGGEAIHNKVIALDSDCGGGHVRS